MAQGKITDKQREILEYIKETILQKGYPPAVLKSAKQSGLSPLLPSILTWSSLRRTAISGGIPTKPRTIEIIDDTFNLARREVVNVPLLGTVAAGAPILAQENIENYFPIPVEMLLIKRFLCSK